MAMQCPALMFGRYIWQKMGGIKDKLFVNFDPYYFGQM
jgi:hypothetical protein